MSYSTLEFEEFTLKFIRRGYSDIVPGFRIRDQSNWWYDPTFLSELEKPTFRYVIQFLSDTNLKKVRNVFEFLADDVERWLASVSDRRNDDEWLDTEVLTTPTFPTLPTSSDEVFSLFGDEVQPTKPIIVYDGLRGLQDNLAYQIYWDRVSGSDRDTSGVEAWNYKPEYKYFSDKKEKTKLFFGLELEVNTCIPWSDLRKVMTDVAPKQEEFLFAMSDSSIGGEHQYCYEIVSHPMTPRRMRKEYRVFFNKLNNLVAAKGKKLEDVFDFQTKSTGIHIHASRRGFASRYHQRRFHTVWNTDVPAVSKVINKLARRTLSGHQYASPDPYFTGRRLGFCLNTRMQSTSDRYHSCTETHNTYEVRVFTGKPELSNILHSIDSVEAMWYYTRDMPLSAFKMGFEKDFTQWLHKQPKQRFRTLKENLSCV